MTGNEYQELAMRTNDHKASERVFQKLDGCDQSTEDAGGVLNAALGLSGEVGELNDMIKKWIFHEKPIDKLHLKKEIGDVCWYIAMMCEAWGFNLEQIMQLNINKLKERYPEGFDVVRANNRKDGDI